MIVSDSIKRRFVKDYNLPITLFRDDLFQYFMKLYDKSLYTSYKWNKLLDVLERLGEEGFFKESARIIDTVVAEISAHPEYARIQSMSMLPPLPLPSHISTGTVYRPDYVGKLMISIDMHQANFNALRYMSPELLRNEKDYESYLKNFTTHSYFLESKQIRQVIFGNLNPKRQQMIQKYIMSLTVNLVCKKYADRLEVMMTGPDEIIVIYNDELGMYMYELVDELSELMNELPILPITDCHKISPFILESVNCDKNFYVKVPYDMDNERAIANDEDVTTEYNVWDVEFKKVPSYFYPQVYKTFFNLPLSDTDLMFYYEGHYAKFLTNIAGDSAEKEV